MLRAAASAGALALALAQPPPPAISWTHGWATAGDQLWVDFAGAGYADMPTPEQTAFIARTYAVVSVEKCFAQNFGPTELAAADFTAQLQRIAAGLQRPLKVLYYFHAQQDYSYCYNSGKLFNATPAWWLRNDTGAPYGTADVRYHDATQQAVRDFYSQALLNASAAAQAAGAVYSGVFADGTMLTPFEGMSEARNAQVAAGRMATMDQARATIRAPGSGFAPDSLVFGNGLGLYAIDPTHGTNTVAHLDGLCFEHWLAFSETLDPTNGTLIPALFELSRQLVANVTAMGKPVLIRAWPGPVTTPIGPLGPVWPGNTQPTNHSGLGLAALQWLEPVLASYLIVAENSTWLSYNWWYTATDGVFPCPEDTDSCSAPPGWYPDLARPLGAPLGPAARVPGGSGWRYARSFQHADVSFDAADVASATISWH